MSDAIKTRLAAAERAWKKYALDRIEFYCDLVTPPCVTDQPSGVA